MRETHLFMTAIAGDVMDAVASVAAEAQRDLLRLDRAVAEAMSAHRGAPQALLSLPPGMVPSDVLKRLRAENAAMLVEVMARLARPQRQREVAATTSRDGMGRHRGAQNDEQQEEPQKDVQDGGESSEPSSHLLISNDGLPGGKAAQTQQPSAPTQTTRLLRAVNRAPIPVEVDRVSKFIKQHVVVADASRRGSSSSPTLAPVLPCLRSVATQTDFVMNRAATSTAMVTSEMMAALGKSLLLQHRVVEWVRGEEPTPDMIHRMYFGPTASEKKPSSSWGTQRRLRCEYEETTRRNLSRFCRMVIPLPAPSCGATTAAESSAQSVGTDTSSSAKRSGASPVPTSPPPCRVLLQLPAYVNLRLVNVLSEALITLTDHGMILSSRVHPQTDADGYEHEWGGSQSESSATSDEPHARRWARQSQGGGGGGSPWDAFLPPMWHASPGNPFFSDAEGSSSRRGNTTTGAGDNHGHGTRHVDPSGRASHGGEGLSGETSNGTAAGDAGLRGGSDSVPPSTPSPFHYFLPWCNVLAVTRGFAYPQHGQFFLNTSLTLPPIGTPPGQALPAMVSSRGVVHSVAELAAHVFRCVAIHSRDDGIERVREVIFLSDEDATWFRSLVALMLSPDAGETALPHVGWPLATTSRCYFLGAFAAPSWAASTKNVVSSEDRDDFVVRSSDALSRGVLSVKAASGRGGGSGVMVDDRLALDSADLLESKAESTPQPVTHDSPPPPGSNAVAVFGCSTDPSWGDLCLGEFFSVNRPLEKLASLVERQQEKRMSELRDAWAACCERRGRASSFFAITTHRSKLPPPPAALPHCSPLRSSPFLPACHPPFPAHAPQRWIHRVSALPKCHPSPPWYPNPEVHKHNCLTFDGSVTGCWLRFRRDDDMPTLSEDEVDWCLRHACTTIAYYALKQITLQDPGVTWLTLLDLAQGVSTAPVEALDLCQGLALMRFWCDREWMEPVVFIEVLPP